MDYDRTRASPVALVNFSVKKQNRKTSSVLTSRVQQHTQSVHHVSGLLKIISTENSMHTVLFSTVFIFIREKETEMFLRTAGILIMLVIAAQLIKYFQSL